MKTKTPIAIVEGPRGLQMTEATARAIEAKMKIAPKGDEFAYRRVSKSATDFQCDPGSRTDVSTITTEAVDRDREVVLAQGIDLTDYNGAVMFAHDYKQPPVGRNLWIKGKGTGLIAKTQYAARPKEWSGDGWLPDALLSLMQGDPPTCTGKSIGFIPLGYRSPTAQELDMRPEMKGAMVIDKCSLMEYSVTGIPANQEAEMLMVAKGLPLDVQAILLAASKDMDDATTCAMLCPTCGKDGDMSEDDDGYKCAKCGGSFVKQTDGAMTPAPAKAAPPAIIKAFVTPHTIKSYAERKAMEQLAGLPESVAAKMIDRMYELLGRA